MRENRAKQDKRPVLHQAAGYLTGLFALLICPCHIPIYIMLLSGTAAGTILIENRSIALGLFVYAIPAFCLLDDATFEGPARENLTPY